jgi:sirohydrochlorin cobaltochelatase
MKKLLLMAVIFSGVWMAGSAREIGPTRSSTGPDDKLALLMVHFGTTNDATRAVTIEALNARAQEAFPGVEVREAFTSRIVIRRLGERGIYRLDPADALARLADDGYTHILIQPSTVIEGLEMESLRRDARAAEVRFTDIRVGDPLLYSIEDYTATIRTLTAGADPAKAYVLVGHGTHDPSTAQYAMLDHILAAQGHDNFFVGTVEGYPDMEHVIGRLATTSHHDVVLVPFMFVAGEHAHNDIAGDWREALEDAGFTVEVKMEGLGQNRAIQDIYIAHLLSIAEGSRMDIMEKKAIYEDTGEKMAH